MTSMPFTVTESRYIPAIKSTVTTSRHKRTGATLVHLSSEKEREHFFSACFRTPPDNHTGTPHIIEHTVLGGSVKYPVKDPFMEMVRSSMATFINALTYGDRTLYPVGSVNRQDFLNLIDVYMDAVFNPLLKPELFAQEGYRLELQEDDNLVHSGVVYNEMKGAYSDPDSYIEKEIARALYPEGSCGKDSGGDPPYITGLGYSGFRSFYEEHYHPDNCCLFALTGIPFEEFASRMDTLLPDTGEGKKPAVITLQEDFPSPVSADIPFPGENESCTVLSAWKVNNAGDPVETLAFSLLEDVLLEDDSSPVKKELLESGLGTGLSSCGYDHDPIQRNFLAGLKGVKREKAPEVFTLIRNTLTHLADKGLDAKLVKNMLHRKELAMRYIGSGWPYSLMNAVTAAWTHNENIMDSLDLDRLLKSLNERLSARPKLLEEMISKWLLDNPHRADLVFYPDQEHFSALEEKSRLELKDKKENMSQDELQGFRDTADKLQAMTDTPDSPEALASIPKLSLKDIPVEPPSVFHRTISENGRTILTTEMNTSGVCYLDLCLDMTGLDHRLISSLPVYASILTRVGAGGKTHIQMAEEELACSGGIGASITSVTSTAGSTDNFRLILKISGHCLERDLTRMLDLINLRLFSPDLNDYSRIMTVSHEVTEQLRSSLIPRGNAFASLAARSGLTGGHAAAELMGGISFVRRMSTISSDTIAVEMNALREIAEYIKERSTGTLAWTGPDNKLQILKEWLQEHPCFSSEFSEMSALEGEILSGIRINGDTAFAAAAMPGIPLTHEMAASGIVMMRMLSEGYLWDEIRARNGAYGAGASQAGGAISFYSYRDPSPSASIQCFREAVAGGIRKLDLTPRGIEDSIIASVKGIDPPVRPAGANGMALVRHFRDMTADVTESCRSNLLRVNRKSIEQFAQWLSSAEAPLRICVMGDRNVLDSAGVTSFTEL